VACGAAGEPCCVVGGTRTCNTGLDCARPDGGGAGAARICQ
jgi:hypothetical protein